MWYKIMQRYVSESEDGVTSQMIQISILTEYLLNAGFTLKQVQMRVYNFVSEEKFQSTSSKEVHVHFKHWMGEYFFQFDPSQKRNALESNLRKTSYEPEIKERKMKVLEAVKRRLNGHYVNMSSNYVGN